MILLLLYYTIKITIIQTVNKIKTAEQFLIGGFYIRIFYGFIFHSFNLAITFSFTIIFLI